MPKILRVRAAADEKEEQWVRKLAASRHGPADWIFHAQIVVRRLFVADCIASMRKGLKG